MTALLGTSKRLGASVLRSELLGRAVTAVTGGSLRVVTYHEVPDVAAFEAQVSWLRQRYRPVGTAEVLAALAGEPLGPRSVWVTFDDGDPSVVVGALEPLRRLGVPATMFVCPGLIEADEPAWWMRVEAAGVDALADALGRPLPSVEAALPLLKQLPDPERRRIVASLAVPSPPAGRDRHQLSHDELGRWLDAGMDVGSHSWDHPCLDRCDDDEQRRQIALANAWLVDHVPGWVRTFAYPNGNFSPVVEAALVDLGYRLAVLHDHQVAGRLDHALRVSRLHADAADPLPRFRSVVSGVQPAVRRSADQLRSAVARHT